MVEPLVVFEEGVYLKGNEYILLKAILKSIEINSYINLKLKGSTKL